MVPWLKDLGEQSLLVLCPMGKDQAAPTICSTIVGIVIHVLQCGMAYAAVQVSSGGVVAGVEVVWLHVLHVAHGINEAIRRVHWDQHYTPIVVDKEAKGTPLTQITSSFKGVMCCFQVDLYVGHKIQDLFWGIEVGLDVAYYKPYVDVSDLLMLVICLEDEEYGCHPTELKGALSHRGHKCALHDELPQVVQGNALHVKGALDGAEANVPQVETILAVVSVPGYRTLACKLEEYLAEVECSHLEEQVESLL